MSEHFASWTEAGIQIPPGASGRIYMLCPRCSHDRSAEGKSKKCLSVKLDKQSWDCFHCGWSGYLTNGQARISLADLASNKRISVAFLRELGLHDLSDGGVGIRYRRADGTTAYDKRRTALIAKEGFVPAQGRKAYAVWPGAA